jgi:hypothetical protein
MSKEVSVGAFVSLGVIVFAVGVMAISKERRLFTPKVRYWSRFDNTSGLADGSPVRLVGVQIVVSSMSSRRTSARPRSRSPSQSIAPTPPHPRRHAGVPEVADLPVAGEVRRMTP